MFPETLCGTMDDRERLGLPSHYLETPLQVKVTQSQKKWYGQSKDQLVDLMQQVTAPLADRIAAGNLLAILGDPRIDVYHPPMVTIMPSATWLGTPLDEIDDVLKDFNGLGLQRALIEKESPAYAVSLKPFKMAKYPVTNEEYLVFLKATGFHEIPTSWTFRKFPQILSNHPVYTLSPQAAQAYIEWLSQVTQREFRLPTEAEWEYAAAGPDRLTFPWGHEFDAFLCNTAESGIFESTAIGAFLGGESPFGLADMAGNVEEYVADQYGPYPGGAWVQDHLVDIHGHYHVARGGSFARFRDLARTRRRHGHNPRSATYAMGFRLAETI